MRFIARGRCSEGTMLDVRKVWTLPKRGENADDLFFATGGRHPRPELRPPRAVKGPGCVEDGGAARASVGLPHVWSPVSVSSRVRLLGDGSCWSYDRRRISSLAHLMLTISFNLKCFKCFMQSPGMLHVCRSRGLSCHPSDAISLAIPARISRSSSILPSLNLRLQVFSSLLDARTLRKTINLFTEANTSRRVSALPRPAATA